jgi:DNA-binding response OmpR family regulator
MLPHMNGFEILKTLREEKISSKIIMLTAKNTIDDKMIGFNNGADDYLTKPFHMEELLARVNVQLRKTNGTISDIIDLGDISLNIKSMELSNKNEDSKVKIIGKEFQLLELFMGHPNQVMEKEQLFVKIWGYESECDINTLEAYISFIRKKLKLIKSNVKLKAIRNMGYVLEVSDEEIKK